MSSPESSHKSLSARLLFRLAASELLQMRSLVLLLILNLAVGLSGYLTLSTFQDSLKAALRANAKSFLSADATLSVRRQFTEDEQKLLKESAGAEAKISRQWEFFSMITNQSDSRLVQIKAIDDIYPLYGEIQLEQAGLVTPGNGPRLGTDFKAWVYPELLLQLNMKVGDSFDLGGKTFVIADVVKDDSTQSFRMASLAPKIYVSRLAIAQTQLVQFGTTLSDILMIRIPEMPTATENLKLMGDKIKAELKDPGINWTTYVEAGEDTGRFMGYLFDYLGLGSLVGVSLAAFGLAALIRSWLSQKLKVYAVYKALGISSAMVRRIFLLQMLIISLGTAMISALFVGLGLPFLGSLLSEFVATPVDIALQPMTFVKATLLICLGSFGVTLPYLAEIRDIPTQRLFSEGSNLSSRLTWTSVLWWIPVLAGFWFLSVRESSSYLMGSAFVATLLACYIVLALVGYLLFRVVAKFGRRWWVRQGLFYLERKPALLTTFVALSLGATLTALIPQVKAGLYDEIQADPNSKRPALFFFDIQDDQKQGFEDFIKESKHELTNLSPLIRSRILAINGQNFERVESKEGFQTREEENEARFRNRGVNLSYRSELTESEKIIDGRPMVKEARADGIMELSVEFRYAGRMGMKIGDMVDFDIQGVEMQGEVVNLREVKWNSFQPNFFIQVQPGFLDEAPKIWLASLSHLKADEVNQLQTQVAKKFPNVSAIDVGRLVEKAMEVVNKMLFALQLMSVLTWMSGFLVLLSILYRQLTTQERDAVLFRLLGASSRSVFQVFQVEFGVLVLFASLFGSALAVAMSLGTAVWFFEGIFALDWFSLGLGIFGLSFAAVVFTSLFSLRLSKSNPAGVLQDSRL